MRGRPVRAVRPSGEGVAVVDVPEPDAGGGSLVNVRSASICGSDLHMLELQFFSGTFGHEFAGVLDDGTPVAIEPSVPCGTCDQCLSGASHLCRTGAERFPGVAVDGGMAERIRVPAASLVPLPAGLTVANACLVEPLAVATHGLRVAGVSGDEAIAVVGAGGIGLFAAAAAVAAGSDVAVEARHDMQRAAAERLGASVTPDGEYDIVIEAAGTESALARAVELCRPGGVVLFLSTHWVPITLPGIPSAMKELRYQWSYTYGTHGGGRDVDAAAMLLARNPEIAATLVTHRFPLEDAPEAFRVAGDRAHGAIKVVIDIE